MSKKIIVLGAIFLSLIITSLPIVNATLACPQQDYNENDSIIYCNYTSSTNELLEPKLFNNDGLVYQLLTKSIDMVAGTKYFFKIAIDVYSSKIGDHNLTITQGKEKVVKKITIKRNNLDIDYNIVINYPLLSQTISAQIVLVNNTKKSYPVLLKATDIPNGLELNLEQKIFTLKSNESIKIPLKIEYEESQNSTLKYTLYFGSKKEDILINLEKDKMPITYKPNKITAFFNLTDNANSNIVIIVLDIVLFVLVIVLFTMFIGRLGKLIVKK